MSISDERIEQIMSFVDEFDPDCPPLTERQLSQLRPSHLVNRELWRPQKKVLNIRIDADLLDSLRASGAGWQSRLNEWIRTGIVTHQL